MKKSERGPKSDSGRVQGETEQKTNEEWVKAAAEKEAKEKDDLLLSLVQLKEENAALRSQLGLVHDYRVAAAPPPRWLLPKKKPDPGAATACMQFSDWHLDEYVDPAQVNGLNAFDRSVATLRLRRWADKACELGELHRHRWDGALVFANGDFVSGEIHDELVRSNEASLPETVVHWAPLIAAAYKQVAEFYGHLHVSVMRGNHGRRTHKPEAKGAPKNSFDWLLMQLVQAHLREESNISWDFASSLNDFVQIYDRHVHVSHGDSVKGGNGIAGIWSPLGKLRSKAIELASVQGLRIRYCIAGHWHQTIMAHEAGLSINGAGKGYDEFAMKCMFPHEQAKQNWFVEHSTRGVTVRTPIWLEDRKAEGW